MSSLIVTHDQRIMMLEFAVENLHVPQNSIFDKAILKKVTVMFRFLDEDWTELLPNRRDYRSYRGSNYENERFYGGRSVVFALPESSLEKPMNAIDVQVYVFKEICDYFELDSCENVGFTFLRVDHLINAIIKELQERKELGPYLCNSHENDPISRSLIGTYTLMNDDLKETDATIKIYIRITYLGNCIITEFENTRGIKTAFHCRKDNAEGYPYQLRELTSENFRTGCWGSQSYLPPAILKKLKCYCEQDKIKKQMLTQLTEASKTVHEAEATKIAREDEADTIARKDEVDTIAREDEADTIVREAKTAAIVHEAEPAKIARKAKITKRAHETEAAKITREAKTTKITREAEITKITRGAEAAHISKLKGLEKEESKKKKKKKKIIDADAHIFANIDNLYNEKIRFIMQAMKKRKARGLGGAGVAFSRRDGKKICPPLLATSPIHICSPIVGPCSPCPNFLPCFGSQALPFATCCL
ncbi:PREDICTED: uncharacterized protein LOC107066277 [Polistes dominula]|uniref:Uncharacterized protein LOC107066277 n=1 Tax=Polistes dominula TaxID=743375 RepID=A0ABM1I7Q6_POLDO|nr:PREDICTED: uncharacterized protein LOC107066277 [Polistes dominula]